MRDEGSGPLAWFTACLSLLQARWQGNQHFPSGLVFILNTILVQAVISATSSFSETLFYVATSSGLRVTVFVFSFEASHNKIPSFFS